MPITSNRLARAKGRIAQARRVLDILESAIDDEQIPSAAQQAEWTDAKDKIQDAFDALAAP